MSAIAILWQKKHQTAYHLSLSLFLWINRLMIKTFVTLVRSDNNFCKMYCLQIFAIENLCKSQFAFIQFYFKLMWCHMSNWDLSTKVFIKYTYVLVRCIGWNDINERKTNVTCITVTEPYIESRLWCKYKIFQHAKINLWKCNTNPRAKNHWSAYFLLVVGLVVYFWMVLRQKGSVFSGCLQYEDL